MAVNLGGGQIIDPSVTVGPRADLLQARENNINRQRTQAMATIRMLKQFADAQGISMSHIAELYAPQLGEAFDVLNPGQGEAMMLKIRAMPPTEAQEMKFRNIQTTATNQPFANFHELSGGQREVTPPSWLNMDNTTMGVKNAAPLQQANFGLSNPILSQSSQLPVGQVGLPQFAQGGNPVDMLAQYGQQTGDIHRPALIGDQEFVVNKEATQQFRPWLDYINSMVPNMDAQGLPSVVNGIPTNAEGTQYESAGGTPAPPAQSPVADFSNKLQDKLFGSDTRFIPQEEYDANPDNYEALSRSPDTRSVLVREKPREAPPVYYQDKPAMVEPTPEPVTPEPTAVPPVGPEPLPKPDPEPITPELKYKMYQSGVLKTPAEYETVMRDNGFYSRMDANAKHIADVAPAMAQYIPSAKYYADKAAMAQDPTNILDFQKRAAEVEKLQAEAYRAAMAGDLSKVKSLNEQINLQWADSKNKADIDKIKAETFAQNSLGDLRVMNALMAQNDVQTIPLKIAQMQADLQTTLKELDNILSPAEKQTYEAYSTFMDSALESGDTFKFFKDNEAAWNSLQKDLEMYQTVHSTTDDKSWWFGKEIPVPGGGLATRTNIDYSKTPGEAAAAYTPDQQAANTAEAEGVIK